MSTPRAALLLTAAALVAGAVALPLPAGAAAPGPGTTGTTGLPAGVPDAALRPEPVLPTPPSWAFGEQFPRTSGTGRLAGGASFWTDFVYDDHGATDPTAFPANLLSSVATLAPTQGVYRYPEGPASGNGADVFRTAVGLDAEATHWRVDWTTLVDADVPIAVWGVDLDDDPATGSSAWPAAAGVSSPGNDRFLVMSSRGARLLDGAGAPVAELPVRVDLPSRSFVVQVPRSVLPVEGSSRLRLVAGLADQDGTGLAVPTTTTGQPAPGTRVYNASFRSVEDEPPVYGEGTSLSAQLAGVLTALLGGDLPGLGLPDLGPVREQLLDQVGLDGLPRLVTGNFWMEDHQAEALAEGDVTAFSERVDWTALAAGATTPEPAPSGYSNRWYVSALDLGQGVVEDESSPGDLRPNYLSRVQPYAVQVPEGVAPGAPLTWMLHSLGVNHNQYGALNGRTLGELCDDRGSVCATTLGHGPDSWYFDEGEADFWQVWREVARTYRTSTEHTVLGGYSMGGYAAYKLGLAHADLFAAALVLAGPPSCGVQVAEGLLVPSDTSDPSSRCAADGPTAPLLGNSRWLPYVIAHGGLDELVPVTSVLERVAAFDALGHRHHFSLYPAEDHLVYATQDRFSTEVDALGGTPTRVGDPGRVSHAWYPHLDDAGLGIGVTTAYWLSGLRAADDAPGAVARVEAVSRALPEPEVEAVRTGPTPLLLPTPGVATGLAWRTGAAPPAEQRLDLALDGVSALTVDAARAGLGCGAVVRTSADAPAELTVTGLPAGARLDDAPGAVATLPAGSSERVVVCAAAPASPPGGGPQPVPAAQPLPVTGGAAPALLAAGLLLAAAAVRRRSVGADA